MNSVKLLSIQIAATIKRRVKKMLPSFHEIEPDLV